MNPIPETVPLAEPVPRRPGDVRWRAIALTVILVVLGGLLLEFYDKIPNVTSRWRSAVHADSKTKAEIDQRFQQGVAMLHARQYEHALTAFHRVLQLAPQMPEAHVNAGFALLGLQDYKVARDFFEAATALRPSQLNAYFGLAEALRGLGDNFGAMQAMETYVHLAPKDDPFRRRAEAAVWELRAQLEQEKAAQGAKPAAQPGEKK